MSHRHQHIFELGSDRSQCLICQDLKRQAARRKKMIPVEDAKELREQLDSLMRSSKLLAESFENDEAGDDTISEDMLTFMEDRADNVRDLAMGLSRAITYLMGRAEGKWLEAPAPGIWSDTDELGNTIHRITPGCAPCSEIGRSFATERRPEGLRAQLISGMAKDLCIRPAGEVRWLLARSGLYSDAPAFDRQQWEKLRELAIHRGLIPANGNYYPPPRMLADEEAVGTGRTKGAT